MPMKGANLGDNSESAMVAATSHDRLFAFRFDELCRGPRRLMRWAVIKVCGVFAVVSNRRAVMMPEVRVEEEALLSCARRPACLPAYVHGSA